MVNRLPVIGEIEAHIQAAQAFYRPLILNASGRMSGGGHLLAHFDQAVSAFRRHGRRQVSGVIERVNELAVANQLLMDPAFAAAAIAYEPVIVPGAKFDFVIAGADGQSLFVEVKTVSPQTSGGDVNWRTATYRGRRLSRGTHFDADQDAMAAAIFGNAFAARSSFLKYTLETEAKLANHGAVLPGRGVLVFCGDGFGWDTSELEDFADFYRLGRHRDDDPFGEMERHAMAKGGVALSRSLAGFAALVRPQDAVTPAEWVCLVGGPNWGW